MSAPSSRLVTAKEWVDLSDAAASAHHALTATAWDYLMGGAGLEGAIDFAHAAYAERALIPRILRGVEKPELSVSILGMPSTAPICVCPVGSQSMFHPEGELATARGARACGIPAVIGCMATSPFSEIHAITDRWAIQVYPFEDRGITNEMIAAALEHGATAVVFTADVPIIGRRSRDLRNGFSILVDTKDMIESSSKTLATDNIWAAWSANYTWDDVARIVDSVSVPVAVKGILHPEDAQRALAVGCRGIWLSAHGGRQLDDAAAPLDVLPGIADLVAEQVEIIVDGGTRSGADVVKALALGATSVAIGRPAMWGLAAAGSDGVSRVFELLMEELVAALILMGVSNPRSLRPADVIHVPSARQRVMNHVATS